MSSSYPTVYCTVQYAKIVVSVASARLSAFLIFGGKPMTHKKWRLVSIWARAVTATQFLQIIPRMASNKKMKCMMLDVCFKLVISTWLFIVHPYNWINMMRFPSTVASLAAKRVLSSTHAPPAAFARFGAMRMMSAAPSVKVSFSLDWNVSSRSCWAREDVWHFSHGKN